MTKLELFTALSEISPEYLAGAESLQNHKTVQKRFKRPLLVAAIIIVLLLLAGCTVVCMMYLQEIKIDEWTHYGDQVETWDILSIRSAPGSPGYLAAKEWWNYSALAEPGAAEEITQIPENLQEVYLCRSVKQMEILYEIAAKYQLKLLGKPISVQEEQLDSVLKAMGLTGICRENAGIQERKISGVFYPEGDFRYECEFSGIAEKGPIYALVFYTRKDSFNPEYLEIAPYDFEQWHYTTAEKMDVLLAKSNCAAMIFMQTGEADITVLMSADGLTEEAAALNRKDLERIADAINLNINSF